MLTNAANAQRYISFVVRDDNQHGRLPLPAERDDLPGLQQLPRGHRDAASTSSTASPAIVPATGTVGRRRSPSTAPTPAATVPGQFAGDSWNWERLLHRLAGEVGLRRHLLDRPGHPHRRRPAAAVQGVPLGRARRVLVQGDVRRGDRRPRPRASTSASSARTSPTGRCGSSPRPRGAADRVMVCYKDDGAGPGEGLDGHPAPARPAPVPARAGAGRRAVHRPPQERGQGCDVRRPEQLALGLAKAPASTTAARSPASWATRPTG